jgi:putative chitinase
MSTHENTTNKTKTVTLSSSIERVQWADQQAAPGGTVGIKIETHSVGNGSTLQIKLTDHRGRSHGTHYGRVHKNHLSTPIQVPSKARDALYAEVKFPNHGLKQKSPPLLLTAPVKIRNAEWSQDEACRGDLLTLSADVKGVPDGTEAQIQIFEHDEEDAHDLITQLSTLVENQQVEVEWKYEYHEDTDRIPTEEEVEKGYRPPEYFFRVEVEGIEADSGLLTFNDQLFVQLIDAVEQVAYALQDYLLRLPDGTEKTGTLDEKGRLQIDKALPGPYEVTFPEIYDQEPQGEQVEGSSGEDDVTDSDAAPDGKAKAGVQSGSQHCVEHEQCVTLDQLARAVPDARRSDLKKYVGPLNDTMKKYDIAEEPIRIAHFIAQLAHESSYPPKDKPPFAATEEVGSRKYFKDNYGYVTKFGNTQKGDGPRFRGRGLIQLTWHNNYKRYENYKGLDLTSRTSTGRENREKLVNDPDMAADVAGWYWKYPPTKSKSLNEYADDDNVKDVTEGVNGGLNKLKDRKRRLKKTKDVFLRPA